MLSSASMQGWSCTQVFEGHAHFVMQASRGGGHGNNINIVVVYVMAGSLEVKLPLEHACMQHPAPCRVQPIPRITRHWFAL